jgi:hypothetical protein
VTEPDRQLRRIERNSIGACLAMAIAAWAVARGGWEAPAGVLAGGAIAAVSYRGIKAGVDSLVEAASGGRVRRLATIGLMKYLGRYAILAAVAYVTMTRLRLPPLAVFVGASSFVVAMAIEAVRHVTDSS